MPTIPYRELEAFISLLFQRLNTPANNADLLAAALLQTEAKGVYSHGVSLTATYARQIKAGYINTDPAIRIIRENAGTAHIDGDGGLGVVVSTFAAQTAVRKAKACGSATVCVKNASHYGAGLVYADIAVKAGTIAYLYANTNPAMAPFGGRQPYYGTNPYTFGAPMGKYAPYILDMATTVAAYSKLLHYIATDTPAPEGWGLDRQGRPTTDAAEISQHGSLLPFGGAKGSGLAGMIDIVSGVLPGAAFRTDIRCQAEGADKLPNFGSFMQVTDVESFLPQDEFTTRMEQLAEDILQAPPAAGRDGVFYPGYLEAQRMEQAKKEGVTLSDSSWTMLCEAALAAGLNAGAELPYVS